MSEELCFCIENENLFLEQVLVDYKDVPIFFLCSNKKYYYLALCTDIDELSYIVTKVSIQDVYKLLHGQIPMRDVILKQKEYWNIISEEDICLDIVTKCPITQLDTSVLPQENAYFKVLTKKLESFVYKFDAKNINDLYLGKSFLIPITEEILQADISIEVIEKFGIVTGLHNYDVPSLVIKNECYEETVEKFKDIKLVKVGLQRCNTTLIWSSDDLYDAAIAV